MPRLTYLDDYSTTAASFGGTDDYIEVAAVPDIGDKARGTVAVPITIVDSGGGYNHKTICTGWDTATSRLYIDAMYVSSGTDVTIMSAPNNAVMQCQQQAIAVSGSLSSGTYEADYGITHEVNITGAGTIEVQTISGTPFSAGYEQVFNSGQVTRLLLKDADGDQPAITWAASSGSLYWADGDDAQFSVGKSLLVVEIVGGGTSHLYGRYWAYT